MNYIYAALLLHSAKKPVDEKSLKKVLDSAGIESDGNRVKALVAALSEVDIDEALKTATAIPAAVPAAAPAEEKPAKGEKKPKEEEEKKDEEALEGLGALFG